MADDEPSDDADEQGRTDEEKSFRERVEEMRERREASDDGDDDEAREERMRELLGGGGPGGAGMGGNPFAQMMSGMMGGGAGMGAGPGMGGSPQSEQGDDERLVRELRQLRDEVHDATRQLERIADALEDD